MRSWIWVLIGSLVLARGTACFATGSKETPASDHPSTAAWGPDYLTQNHSVFDRVLSVSGLAPDTRLAYFFSEATGEGCSLVCAVPGSKGAPDSVEANYHIFELARDEDQLAFIYGHELTHLIRKHEAVRHEYVRTMKHTKAGVERGLELLRAQEREADKGGQELARRAGFKSDGATAELMQMQDLKWAEGWEIDEQHDPEILRIDLLQRPAAFGTLKQAAEDPGYFDSSSPRSK